MRSTARRSRPDPPKPAQPHRSVTLNWCTSSADNSRQPHH
jgi:hypothetical protein